MTGIIAHTHPSTPKPIFPLRRPLQHLSTGKLPSGFPWSQSLQSYLPRSLVSSSGWKTIMARPEVAAKLERSLHLRSISLSTRSADTFPTSAATKPNTLEAHQCHNRRSHHQNQQNHGSSTCPGHRPPNMLATTSTPHQKSGNEDPNRNRSMYLSDRQCAVMSGKST
jgi:hypothetical protein